MRLKNEVNVKFVRLWNYIYYCTWGLLNIFNNTFIKQPISFFVEYFPKLKRNWEIGAKDLESFVNGRDLSVNMSYSFTIMFLSTNMLLISLSLFLVPLFDSNSSEHLLVYFFILPGISYIFNNLLLWKDDHFKEYFEIFDSQPIKKAHYFYTLLFHFSMFIILICSIHFTIGFSI